MQKLEFLSWSNRIFDEIWGDNSTLIRSTVLWLASWNQHLYATRAYSLSPSPNTTLMCQVCWIPLGSGSALSTVEPDLIAAEMFPSKSSKKKNDSGFHKWEDNSYRSYNGHNFYRSSNDSDNFSSLCPRPLDCRYQSGSTGDDNHTNYRCHYCTEGLLLTFGIADDWGSVLSQLGYS